MKINFKIIMLYVYAFFLLYLPDFTPLFGLNGFVILGLLTIPYLISYISYCKKNGKIFLEKRPLCIFVLLTVAQTIYFALRTMIAGTDMFDIYNLRIIQSLMPIFYIFGSYIVYEELERLQYNSQKKYKFLINLATIQGFIAIAMVLFPQLKEIAVDIAFQNKEENIYIITSRLYGLCNGDYTYSLQIVHSIIALFALYYAYYYKDKKVLFQMLIILLVTFLNGRFGLIVFSIGFFVFIIYSCVRSGNLLKFFKICTIALLVCWFGFFIISRYLPNTYNLISHAVNDVISFYQENDSTTETYALVSSFRFPKGIDFFFGKGYRVFGGKGKVYNPIEKSADIGFVNDMYMGGLVYCFLLYGGYLILIKEIKRMSFRNSFERIFNFVLLLSMILVNIKGEALRNQMVVTLFSILLVFLLFEGEKNYEKKEL